MKTSQFHLLGLFTGTAVLAVYLATICPGVWVGDCGEQMAACYTMGICHPPGYPLFTILGKFFTFLPFSSLAFRVNLNSAFFGACAATGLFYLVRLFTSSNIVSLSCSMVFAFTETFWAQCVMTEVYAMNSFFVIITIYLFFYWYRAYKEQRKPGWRILYLFSFVYGLSLTNHNTMGPMGPIFLIFFLYLKWKNWDIRLQHVITVFGLALLGCLVYAYLPIRSLTNPAINWGNPSNFNNFIHTILRQQYDFPSKTRTVGLLLAQSGAYAMRFVRQFTPWLVWLILPGIVCLFRKDRFLLAFTVVSWLVLVVTFIILSNFKINNFELEQVEVFFISSYAVAAIWIAFGLNWLSDRIKKASYLLVLIPLIPLFVQYQKNDRSRDYIAHNYGLNVLSTVPQNSILFLAGEDNEIFPLAYFIMVEKRRQDITVMDDNGCVFTREYGDDFKFLSEASRNLRMNLIQYSLLQKHPEPSYCNMGSNVANLILGMPEYVTQPVGLLYRIAGKNRPETSLSSPNIWPSYRSIFSNTSWNEKDLTDERIIQGDFFSRGVAGRYHYYLGEYYCATGDKKKGAEEFHEAGRICYDISWMHNALGNAYNRQGFVDAAISEFERVTELDPKRPEPFDNLGTIYLSQGKFDMAIKNYKQAVVLNPNYLAAHNNLGIVYLKLNDREAAKREWMWVVQKDPTCEAARINLKSNFPEVQLQ